MDRWLPGENRDTNGGVLVDFWFDPACPYTWLTSRWLTEVTLVRPVTVRWRVMSLSVLNEGRDDDPEGDPHGYLWIPARVCAAVQQQHGHEALGRFYTELWRPEPRDGDWMGDHADALERAGLSRQLVDVGASNAYDDEVRASHAAAMAELGPHVGTPIVATTRSDGTRVAFFGPVVSRVPTGERAGALWDAHPGRRRHIRLPRTQGDRACRTGSVLPATSLTGPHTARCKNSWA